MNKLTVFTLIGLILSGMIFIKGASAITTQEISAIIADYPDNYFTNSNTGIKNSFIKHLDTIGTNINLFNTENDQVFKTELDQEINTNIQYLISKTNGCIEGNNSPDPNDWLVDCQAQNEIFLKLNELSNSY